MSPPTGAPASWEAYTRGAHADPAYTPPRRSADDDVVTVLIAEDRDGAKAAERRASLLGDVDDLGVSRWTAVERAHRSAGSAEDRIEALEALAAMPPGNQWSGIFSEGRRLGLMAEIEGRRNNRSSNRVNDWLEEARTCFEPLDDRYGDGWLALVRGRALAWQGDLDSASQSLTLALVRFAVLGNRFRISDTIYELAGAYRDLRYDLAAGPLHEVAEQIASDLGNASQLARARRGLAITLHQLAERAEERMDEPEERRLLRAARSWAERAYTATTTLDAADADAPDSYRATMAALDLSAIAEAQKDPNDAKRWFEVATRESGLDALRLQDRGETIFNQHVTPAFVGLEDLDLEAGAATAKARTRYSYVRLAERELHFRELVPDVRDSGQAQALIARLWLLRQEDPKAIGALLEAAAEAGQAADDAQAAGHPDDGAAFRARRWRHLAQRHAERLGADLTAPGLDLSPVDLTPAEAVAQDEAGLLVTHLLDDQPGFRTFRVVSVDDHRPAHLTVSESPVDKGLLAAIARLSHDRPELPIVRSWSATPDGFWLVDEEVVGQPLAQITAGADPATARYAIAGLCSTIDALHRLGIVNVVVDPSSVVVGPGAQTVLGRYAPVRTPVPDKALYPSGLRGAADDAAALGLLVLRWVLGEPTLELKQARRRLRRDRFLARGAIGKVSLELANALRDALDGRPEAVGELADTLY
ncbi:MAG: hypothetical protein AAGA48_12640 [Myxococcota bacterium]